MKATGSTFCALNRRQALPMASAVGKGPGPKIKPIGFGDQAIEEFDQLKRKALLKKNRIGRALG